MALEWLSPRDRDWVARNRYFLEAVWDRFQQSGEWPDPVEVQRELRAADRSRRVNAALAKMPGSLARREYAPARLILSIFGIACCNGGRDVLRQYLQVSRLALRRFDSPELPNRLTRAEVVAKLGLDETEADRLSKVLMNDAPFLGSGTSSIESWDREVHPQVEEFEGITNTNSLISFLSSQRGIAAEHELPPVQPLPHLYSARQVTVPTVERAPAVPAGRDSGDPHTNVSTSATVSSLATIATFAITVAQSPSIPGMAISGGLLGLTIGLFWKRSWRYLTILAVAGVALGVIAGMLFSSRATDDGGPYRYFVASTGKAAAVVGLIEPRRGAAKASETMLGLGDSTAVSCLLREHGELWAQLPNGTFVPAELLTAEVGGQDAPPC